MGPKNLPNWASLRWVPQNQTRFGVTVTVTVANGAQHPSHLPATAAYKNARPYAFPPPIPRPDSSSGATSPSLRVALRAQIDLSLSSPLDLTFPQQWSSKRPTSSAEATLARIRPPPRQRIPPRVAALPRASDARPSLGLLLLLVALSFLATSSVAPSRPSPPLSRRVPRPRSKRRQPPKPPLQPLQQSCPLGASV